MTSARTFENWLKRVDSLIEFSVRRKSGSTAEWRELFDAGKSEDDAIAILADNAEADAADTSERLRDGRADIDSIPAFDSDETIDFSDDPLTPTKPMPAANRRDANAHRFRGFGSPPKQSYGGGESARRRRDREHEDAVREFLGQPPKKKRSNLNGRS